MSALPVIACCKPLAAPALSDDEAEATSRLFKALGDPARVKILNLLATSDEPICVCELIPAARPLSADGQPPPEEADGRRPARREQRGVWAYYSIDPDAVAQLGALADLTGGGRR